MMGNLTANISRHEVACKCGCGFDTLDIQTAEVVQCLCNHISDTTGEFRVILIIHSGCRCPEYNTKVGGSDDSQHIYGRALDFHIEGIDPALIYEYLARLYPHGFGIGKYKTFTHLDTKSGGPRRWKG